jgi:hypothetical protein
MASLAISTASPAPCKEYATIVQIASNAYRFYPKVNLICATVDMIFR